MIDELDIERPLVLRFAYVTGMNADGSLAHSEEYEKGVFTNLRNALLGYRLWVPGKEHLYYCKIVDPRNNQIVRPL